MQQNKENRSFKIITAIALCVAVLCLSVAYAALSQQLKITGTATVEATNWSIDGPGDTEITPDDEGGKREGEGDMTGTIDDNGEGVVTVSIDATLKKPGDAAEIVVPIKNNGDIDAHLSSVSGLTSAIQCAGSGETVEADKTIMCTNAGQTVPAPGFKYTIYYNNEAIDANSWETQVTGSERNLAKTSGEAKVKIRVEFDPLATKVPANNVTVTLPEITIAFQQGLVNE